VLNVSGSNDLNKKEVYEALSALIDIRFSFLISVTVSEKNAGRGLITPVQRADILAGIKVAG